jgi:hypothetical protein
MQKSLDVYSPGTCLTMCDFLGLSELSDAIQHLGCHVDSQRAYYL